MGDMGDQQLGVWPRHVVIRQLVGSAAVAIQRGNAVAVLSAQSRALAAMAGGRRGAAERGGQVGVAREGMECVEDE